VATGSGPGARGPLPAADGAPEGGDKAAEPGAPRHGPGRPGCGAADDCPGRRLLHSPAGEGRDRGRLEVQRRGPPGELRWAGSQHL